MAGATFSDPFGRALLAMFRQAMDDAQPRQGGQMGEAAAVLRAARSPAAAAGLMDAEVAAGRAAAHQPGTGGEWTELGAVIPARPNRGNPPWKL
jgi:hypothetical protein